jgi:hypothetical protein
MCYRFSMTLVEEILPAQTAGGKTPALLMASKRGLRPHAVRIDVWMVR